MKKKEVECVITSRAEHKNSIKRYEIARKNINEITWKKVVRTSE